MNRIELDLAATNHPVLNVYFTAGYPELNSTRKVLRALKEAGADMVEIGMPYSDPLADGTTIQESSALALKNGMTMDLLFEQLEGMRLEVDLPVILMGYLNPVMQYGIEEFCLQCREVGVDGLIIPDLPMELFDEEYASIFKKFSLDFIFLITPETDEERIRALDTRSTGFLYMVSSSATTGATGGLSEEQLDYFERVQKMGLRNKRLIGFGISDRVSFQAATAHADGAIIGSAFIKQLGKDPSEEGITKFIQGIKGVEY
jgi:tryptophan synthase alpha chain